MIPYLTPYSLNTVEIDPKGIPLDVEFKSTSQQVAPRANSVVMIHFGTVTGRAAMISARLPNGAQLPFGATVYDTKGQSVGASASATRIPLTAQYISIGTVGPGTVKGLATFTMSYQ
ncbi:fimbria/pilus outer membrane usher protein [Paraburkholderia sp.]|uniref:fimbria/pilus outer membrane usher protein n=1 Tax=Paraburkholderia sp. TaxID=1926495 RepID=UPI002D639346|nr:fimbria/pilus outer membrane usher protein [Paraburkholderia sp.]HZZ02369.1 fimbria/pilus outer membrane usher protein [Paraburkholderia sp.]